MGQWQWPSLQSYRLPVLEGIAAGIGMVVGCTGTWVRVTAMLSVRGLDASVWVEVGLVLGAVSALGLVIVFIGQQVGLPARLATLLVWLGLVSGSYGAAFSIPYIIRVLTIPKAEILGVEIRAEIGWALWLFGFSSLVLLIAASLAVEQFIRANQLPNASGDLSKEARLYRSVAIATSAAIGIAWVVFYAGKWNGDPLGEHSVPTDTQPRTVAVGKPPLPPTVTETVTAPPMTTIPTSIPSGSRSHTATVIVGTCDEGGTCGVLQRARPYNDATKLYDSVLKDGATVFVVCQTTGDYRSSEGYGSSNVWYQLDNGAYISSVYTPLVAEGIPQC